VEILLSMPSWQIGIEDENGNRKVDGSSSELNLE
jgi:hypothetical protein